MNSGIYGILNLLNGKIYIGSAVNPNSRWRTHKANLNLNKHSNKHLQSAWNECGSFAFEFVILERISDKTILVEREQAWFDLTLCCEPEFGYNKLPVAGSRLGLKYGKQSPEWIEKRASKLRGKIRSAEWRENMAAAQRGKKHTAEHRAKVSAAGIGRIVSPERRAKIGKANSRPDKWPHPEKYKCRCVECLSKKNRIRRPKYILQDGVYVQI